MLDILRRGNHPGYLMGPKHHHKYPSRERQREIGYRHIEEEAM